MPNVAERQVNLNHTVEGQHLAFGAPRIKNFQILTNGTLIDDRVADRLAEIKNLTVQVSIDAEDPAAHDAIRGRGSYARTMNAVRLLQGRGVLVTMSFTGAKGNSCQMPGFFNLCSKLNIDEIRVDFVKAVGRAADNGNAACLDEAEFLEAQRELNRLHEKYDWRFASPFDDRVATLGMFAKPRVHCGAGVTMVFIDADGNVYPCTSLDYPSQLGGNIRDKSLKEIFYESDAFKAIRSFDINTVGACRDCFLKYICNGGCWIDGYANCGNFAPSVHCETYKKLAEEKILEYASDPSRMPPIPKTELKSVTP